MKKILYSLAVLALTAAASCTVDVLNTAEIPWEQEVETELVDLTVTVPHTKTKVTDNSGESTISSLQVFVFRDGLLETSAYSSNSEEVSIQCYLGTKTFVAIANNEEIADISKLDQLREKASFLKDNKPDKLVMYGRVDSVEVVTSETIEIPVSRMAARIGIKKITNDTDGTVYDGDLVIKRIFLVNAVGDRRFDSLYSYYNPSIWYNQQAYKGECDELLSSDSLNVVIPAGESYDTPHYFYCYPNPTAEDDDYVFWSPRFTRLAVEATLDDEEGYYSVSIEGIKSNCSYMVTNLIIKTYGANNPDNGARKEFEGEIEIEDWDESETGDFIF